MLKNSIDLWLVICKSIIDWAIFLFLTISGMCVAICPVAAALYFHNPLWGLLYIPLTFIYALYVTWRTRRNENAEK